MSTLDDPWELSPAEIARVLRSHSEARYSYTVNTVREHARLWCLAADDGWALGLDPSDKAVFPVWPHPAFAREVATGDWAGYYPEAIELAEFLERPIEEVGSNEYLLAILPIPDVLVPVPFSHFKIHVLGPRRSRYKPPSSVDDV